MIPSTLPATGIQAGTFPLGAWLAPLLSYPAPDLPDQARAAVEALRAANSQAAKPVAEFAAFVAQTPLSAQEELYTRTFDLKPIAYPYAGFQLFGETYRRGEFMALLQSRYDAAGFVVEGDLPDHLAVIARYLARHADPDLAAEGVIPAVEKLLPALEDNPYRHALHALNLVMQGK